MRSPIPISLVLLAISPCLASTPAGAQLGAHRAGFYTEEDLLFYGPADDDSFAFAVASGDFNGDGADDLATGVPGDDNLGGAFPDAGIVVVRYGIRAGGLALGLADDVLSQAAGGSPDPQEPDDRFGFALASGDFDGDGLDDLAVGAPLDGPEYGGAVQVHYGSITGLDVIGLQFFHQGSPGISGDPEFVDNFGGALAAADFDADGFTDLAIGVPGEDSDLDVQHGRIVVLYGSAGPGLSTSRAQSFDQDTIGMDGSNEDLDFWGDALGAGDFDGDGFDDLAVGAPGENDFAGGVHVMRGSVAGLTVDGNEYWTQDDSGVPGGEESGDSWGWSIAVADFDRDGDDDLAAGAPFEDLALAGGGVAVDAGAVIVLLGSSGGITTVGAQLWTSESPAILETSEANDQFGYALAAGDFAHDGAADLTIGIPWEEFDFNAPLEGAVTVIFGAPGSGLVAAGNQLWQQNSPGVPDLGQEGDEFGRALAVGDFDGSGHSDLVIGGPGESTVAVRNGAEWVLYGTLFADGFASGNTSRWSQVLP